MNARKRIPLSEPEISGNEWRYVKACLDSGWVSSEGEFVRRFEEAFALRLKIPHAIAVSSGTAALHTALLALGIGPGDEVVVPALTFVATANAVIYCGASPRFADVEPATGTLDPKALEAILSQASWDASRRAPVHRGSGRAIRAVMIVHLYGHPADMNPLLSIARQHGLAVVEDATEALGARYRGTPAGALGDVACFSFNGNKIITTGGGGMLVTARDDLARRARYFSTQARDDAVEYLHGDIGFNYRLTSLQAAVGLAQLERLDEFVLAKRRTAARYAELLAGVPGISPPGEQSWATSSFWLCPVLVDEAAYGMGSRELIKTLEDDGIQARPFFAPLPGLRPYQPWLDGRAYPVAERLWRDGVSLPSSVGISREEVEAVASAIVRRARAWAG